MSGASGSWDEGGEAGGRSAFTYVVREASSVLMAPGHRGEPAGALVLFHGRGADEYDLLPLLDVLDPLAGLTAVSVRAPLELVPGGYHWYVMRQVGHPDPPTFTQTYQGLSSFLDELPAVTGVGLDRTVLCGFSQGTVMAYALTFGQGRPSPAALIALSGFIPEAPGFVADLDGHRDVPVAIGHGALDPIIPVEFGRDAFQRLQTAGVDVTYHETPMMTHGIEPAFTQDLAGWLKTKLEERLRAA
jgi:phospholipase/carboxylesterase